MQGSGPPLARARGPSAGELGVADGRVRRAGMTKRWLVSSCLLVLGACGDDAARPQDTGADTRDAAADTVSDGDTVLADEVEAPSALPPFTTPIVIAPASAGTVQVQPALAWSVAGTRLAVAWTAPPPNEDEGIDQRDNVWVAWVDSATATADTTIAARYFVDRDPIDPVQVVSGAGDASGAMVAVDPQGHALLGGVLGLRLSLGVVVPGSALVPVALPEDAGATTTSSAAAALGDDRFALVYFRGTGSAVDLRFGVVSESAFTNDPTTLASGSFPLAYRPAITSRAGRVAAAWTEAVGGGAYAINVVAFAAP